MNDLAALSPRTRQTTIAGKTFELSPIVLEELGTILPLAMPLKDVFVTAGLSNLWRMATDHGSAMVQLTAALSRQPLEWVRGLSVADAIHLFEECMEVNSDFFTDALPRFTRLLKLMAGTSSVPNGSSPAAKASESSEGPTSATPGSGSSQTSSPQATPGAKSGATRSGRRKSSDSKPRG